MAILKVEKLTCYRYPYYVFKGVEFTLQSGQSLALVGKNGIGKTSLLRILAGLAAPEAGSIIFNSTRAYLGHQHGLNLMFTPLENLMYTQTLFGIKSGLKSNKSLLLDVGLSHRSLYRSCHYLSQGQSRRLGIALLMIKKAKLWILDEPFTALDTVGKALFNQIIDDHLKQNGMCVMATHNMKHRCNQSFDLSIYAN